MDKKSVKIAAISAALAAFIGVGVSRTVVGAAPAEIRGMTVRFFDATGDDGKTVQAFEVCAQSAVPGNDAGTEEVIVDQGCESGRVPADMLTKVEAVMTAARKYWKAQKGAP